jgi:hypothetical protein
MAHGAAIALAKLRARSVVRSNGMLQSRGDDRTPDLRNLRRRSALITDKGALAPRYFIGDCVISHAQIRAAEHDHDAARFDFLRGRSERDQGQRDGCCWSRVRSERCRKFETSMGTPTIHIATAAMRPVVPLSHIPSTTAANRTENNAESPTTSCGTPSGSRSRSSFGPRRSSSRIGECCWADMACPRAEDVPSPRSAIPLEPNPRSSTVDDHILAIVLNRRSDQGASSSSGSTECATCRPSARSRMRIV